jgi:2-haloacid dehalogenase
MNRRQFISAVAAGTAATMIPAAQSSHAANSTEKKARTKIKAIAFDAFPIFDPRPVFALTAKLFPDKGVELGKIWRTRQFEYTWLRVAGHHYQDFWKVTEDALVFAADSLKLKLTTAQRQQLMQAYLNLQAWPDVKPALEQFKNNNIKLAFFSNMTPTMLQAGITNSNLDGFFDFILSTDAAKTYKPDPLAYQLGPDAFKLKKEEIVFTAFAGWDAAGAKWFGYPTFWLNRLGFPNERLYAVADASGSHMAELSRYVNHLNGS